MPESEVQTESPERAPSEEAPGAGLEHGTYEVIRNRLAKSAGNLRGRLEELNCARKDVFGAIETTLIATERISTDNSCIARDMVPVGNSFIFGYNVHIGLRATTRLEDVFAVYGFQDHTLTQEPLDLIRHERFERDFDELFKYYKNTVFAKFSIIGPHLFMVFRVGKGVTDIKTFKWKIDGEALSYIDSRSEHEFRFPQQHDFEWKRTHRDMHSSGAYPHVSIEDRVFVETVGGDLTIKIEDNTDTGQGIYSEPVADKDQTLDDAEYFYAIVGSLILLKIRPYQETESRYFVYCEKTRQAFRLDGIEKSCVFLPDEQGLIFSNGYFLQTGEHKIFDRDLSDMVFDARTPSTNGEDYLYAFYNRLKGVYVLLSYNVIAQKVDTPVVCNGHCLFSNGEMIYFSGSPEPQRNHAVQIWQTPFVGPDFETTAKSDSFLYKVGNRDIVRGMAACHEILNLIAKEDTYANLFVDISKKVGDVLDSHHWLGNEEAFNLREDLQGIKEAAQSAISEFEKVVGIRRNTERQLAGAASETNTLSSAIHSRRFEVIGDFVDSLVQLRTLRGKIISLRDLKYIDAAKVDALEEKVRENTDKVAANCVEFLLRPESLQPYATAVAEHQSRIEGLKTVSAAKKLEEEVSKAATELEMLIEVVSNLKIDDATHRTTIIDNISAIFSLLNQTRSQLRNRTQELAKSEGIAEFNSQLKLLNQSVENYLDVCETPEACEEYLTKLMVQIEELEGRFAEFDEFVIQITEEREGIYNAFETRKLQLLEKRNKRATSLMAAAERILRGIQGRVESLKTVNEINGYFAGDLMIEKVRDLVDNLAELGDSVKVDEVQSRLKTIKEDAVRQLKDRLDLYEEGDSIIRLGNHRFSVNTLAFDLTTVLRDGEMYYHLAGTDYFDRIDDAEFLATRDVWDQDVVSENPEVYRGEYLAFQIMRSLGQADMPEAKELRAMDGEALGGFVQKFMGSRYAEAYVKGVHDHDAAIILRALLDLDATIGLLAYHPRARALASVFWFQYSDAPAKELITSKLRGFGSVRELFPDTEQQALYIQDLSGLIGEYVRETGFFEERFAGEAAEYLFEELTRGKGFIISARAEELYKAFGTHIDKKFFREKYDASMEGIKSRPNSAFQLYRDWVKAFLDTRADPIEKDYTGEVAALLLTESYDHARVLDASMFQELGGMVGNHPLLTGKTYLLNYNRFILKLENYERTVVPRFQAYVRMKKELVEEEREGLKLEEFKPRVLTSFVRNKLIDNVYLPLLGDNLAKQIGVAGEKKRTDRMGLLLLISPPGYGKTTLMEYLANRLGIIFMKINGPALGHGVTSLDPDEAPNAAAREEMAKLNLAFEMGDNVMIYVDDIQHCNPEFLQKFISLCDAQRKVEGVHKGKTRTYDLRGKKVAVVMAGNPYTESGEKFKIPDMLANRADTYNLGEIIGGGATDFEMSYLENSITSNPALNKLASKSQSDVYGIIRMAESVSQESVDLEGKYSLEEINEMVGVMKKLMRVRDVVLRVNEEYIRSAGVGEEYRTEPPFKLQGSYRNMNRIAEKVVGIMNDSELETLILGNYENDSQTLTSGAESNLLKFKELTDRLTEEEAARWADIKKTFARNTQMKGLGEDEAMGQVLLEMANVNDGLKAISRTMSDGMSRLGDKDARQIQVVSKIPRSMIGVMSEQFKLMQGWLAPMFQETRNQSDEVKKLSELLNENLEKYQDLLDELHDAQAEDPGEE